MEERVFVDRPPRLQPELPFEEIDIPAPPDKDDNGIARFVQAALPIVAIIGYVLISSFGGARNPIFVIPMALSVMGTVAFSYYSYRKERKRRAEIERAYAERLIEMNKEMHNYHDMQRRFYRYNYPDIATSLRVVHQAQVEAEKLNRTLRSAARLWERRVSDDDFGFLRLGMGTLPSTVVYVLKEVEHFDDPQVREALKLATDSRYVSDIPVVISLRQPVDPDSNVDTDEPLVTEQDETRRTPVTHALGIAGARSEVYTFTRALLAHFVIFHTPFDAKLYVLSTHQREWAWAAHVPHSEENEQTRYRYFTDDAPVAKSARDSDDDSDLDRFLEGIRKVLSQRKIQLQEKDRDEGQGDPTLPFLLVVVDLLDATYDVAAHLHGVETSAALSILLEEGAMLGAAVIFLVPERSKVPSGCQAVIEVQHTAPATNRKHDESNLLHFRYAEVGVNSFRYIGAADGLPDPYDMEQLAHQLKFLDVRQSSGANLASAVPFLDLMGWDSMQTLQARVQQHWHTSTQAEHARWLRVKIGRMAGNKPRALTFSSQADGVHGMVAGSTGSGKSELLISLIIGMAVMYDPRTLNFVLVDYKGGGAFSDFKDLPHCVDIITNLAEDSVTRMFTSIGAEINRRQQVLGDAGTKHIVEYYRQGNHHETPLPFLFIIIDEFAEMIADRSEFKSQLDRITRLGRSLGVSLILAAQRPSGVTDQMRSNIKFRICLRVETPGESREMLRRSDAAYLPTGVPGRGYLQVGNEEIELIQVAYTGDDYVDPDKAPREKVRWPGRRSYAVVAEPEPIELYKEIITTLYTVAQQQKVPQQRAPWPNFLPTYLALSDRLSSPGDDAPAVTSEEYLMHIDRILLGQERHAEQLTLNPALTQWLNDGHGWIEPLDWKTYALRPVVGLIDNPYAARQLPLVVELPRGHAVVFGASGWGKTMFIRTLIISLATTHSPDYFHLYVLDLGGRNLNLVQDLPHVGALITPDEEGYKERVDQLLRELTIMIEQRKTTLTNHRFSDVYEYNAAHPQTPYPAIVVVIDNFVEFLETFGTQSDDTESVLDRFVALVRQSRTYGIHVVISIAQSGDLPTQVYNLFTERFTLKLTDPAEYRTIVGGPVPEIGDIPGRGYTKAGRQPLTFQVAMPTDMRHSTNDESSSESRGLEQLIADIQKYAANAAHAYAAPLRVDPLPRSVLLKQLLLEEAAARHQNLMPDAQFIPRLHELTAQRWQTSLSPQHADWLKALIGVRAGGRPCWLELEAKKSGVHGMIAGGTGAGKSELLMTLIVSLALHYDPTILNFVLVDYKGGGAFAPFKNLPHCVDMITNLNRAGVQRMFTAIRAEMDRRQKVNADAGVSDIVEYRRRGRHLDERYGPYPHLFIIIDEYAEMVADMPEFRDELDSIARVGRSIGVNLLLASQRPTNVSDQMRANIKLRICLRVEGVDASREMLRRSDAAWLPSGMPGRGYLQVGNEQIDLIQVAYTGEKYEHDTPPAGEEQRKFYEVLVDMLGSIGNRPRPLRPWPLALPPALDMTYPLLEAYTPPEVRQLVKMNCHSALVLNPFMNDWLQNTGRWPGVDWRTNALHAVVGLVDNPYKAQQRALEVDFMQGHAVVFGASGWGKTTFLRSLVVSMACTHSPDELHCHILDLGGSMLEALTALPHVGMVISPGETGYEERVQQLWRELGNDLEQRKRAFSKANVSTLAEYNQAQVEQSSQVLPAILLVLDNITEFIETFGETTVNKKDSSNLLEGFVALARQGKAFGVHIIVTANRLNALSSKLYSLFTERYTLRLSDSNDYSAIVGNLSIDIEDIKGRGYTRRGHTPLSFQVALPSGVVKGGEIVGNENRQIRTLGQHMLQFMDTTTHCYREPLRIRALPKSSLYREVLAKGFGISQDEQTFLEELTAATWRSWQHHDEAAHADWLRVSLGPAAGNKLRTLHLEATADGVHGLIAGGTGSGKSELLMTLVVGLALNYSPDILNFVLVDFKGGGSFKPFERLPHCVDVVTNLDATKVDRMFTAINAEIRRRQALNTDTDTKDIIAYRQANLHQTHKPYPHLVIIIDEYAEMIDNHPEYRSELDSITRVGRSLGINLFLAAQRPKGVTDQMRANIKLRLCLRVEQRETSQELLRRPDAAWLPSGQPGRGYLQVGNDNMELIQVGWCGEPQPNQQPRAVLWPHRPPAAGGKYLEDDSLPLFNRAVAIARTLTNGTSAPRLWPGFLPEQFSLQSPLVDEQTYAIKMLNPAVTDWLNADTDNLWSGVDWRDPSAAFVPVVGIIDQPREAKQLPLAFDLKQNHLVVMGDAGTGKTTLVRTLLVELAATHTPAEVHAYVIEMGGRSFQALKHLPHMGAILYNDEETFTERLSRLLDMLERTCNERQQIISDAESDTVYHYNARHPDKLLPAILVVIDNFAEFQESSATLVESTLLPLMRRSSRLGISFVVTCNVPGNMVGKLYNIFTERITLKQTNPDRYIDIVGRGAIELEDIPGRGYIRRGQQPLLFQIARPVGLATEEQPDTRSEAEELAILVAHMNTYLQQTAMPYATPDPIDTLPEYVLLDDILPDTPSRRRVEAVLGRDGNLHAAHFDFKRMGPHFTIAGPPLSGKTTVLYSLVLSLALNYAPERVRLVLIDRQRKLFASGERRSLGELPHVVAVASEEAQVQALIPHLEQECEALAEQERDHEIFVIIDNYDDFNAEIEKGTGTGPSAELARLARRYGREGLHFIISGTLQGTSTTDLRRCIKSSKYGIGLHDVDIFATFGATGRVMPQKSLPGRGYIVRAGHPLVIQVAAPYDLRAVDHVALEEGDIDEETLVQHALDAWIDRVCAQYPTPNLRWIADGGPDGAASRQNGKPGFDQQTALMMRVLARAMQMELAQVQKHLRDGNGATDTEANGATEVRSASMLHSLAAGEPLDMHEVMHHVKQVWRADWSEREDEAMVDVYINTLASDPVSFLQGFDAQNHGADG